jgi:hypothetical protein
MTPKKIIASVEPKLSCCYWSFLLLSLCCWPLLSPSRCSPLTFENFINLFLINASFKNSEKLINIKTLDHFLLVPSTHYVECALLCLVRYIFKIFHQLSILLVMRFYFTVKMSKWSRPYLYAISISYLSEKENRKWLGKSEALWTSDLLLLPVTTRYTKYYQVEMG